LAYVFSREDMTEALEIDLLSGGYGFTVQDFRSGKVRLRVMCLVMAHLPPESLLVRKMSNRPENDWTFDQHRLCDLIELNNYMAWVATVTNWDRKKSGKPPKAPKPLPRPGIVEQEEKKPTHTAKDLALLLKKMSGK
jgi:hypothetical protein